MEERMAKVKIKFNIKSREQSDSFNELMRQILAHELKAKNYTCEVEA